LARFDPEFIDERAAGRSVRLEGLGLASGSVEDKDELAAQPLAERVLRDQHREFSGELVVPS
jgi:hypothetical protein